VQSLALPETLEDASCFIDRPFVVFEVADFLPTTLYERLESTWPDDGSYQYDVLPNGEKLQLDSLDRDFGRFMRSNPDWRELYDYFRSPSTAHQLWALCEPHFGARPAEERRPWRMVPTPKRNALARARRRLSRIGRREGGAGTRPPSSGEATDVFLGFEFSILHEGARIPPHTDTPNKLLSLMLYFPAQGQEELPLGTELYAAKSGRETSRKWRMRKPDDDDAAEFLQHHETFMRLPFTAGSLMGFIKSDISWHGLAPVSPGPVGRRALVVNYFRR
jgi:hypothetical protein